MSHFFWKVKLRVLLDHLPFKGRGNRSGKDEAAMQLKCLEDLKCLEKRVGDGRSQSLPNAFLNPEFKLLESPRQQSVPLDILTCSDARKVFWWFWRCYPQFLENDSDSEALKFQPGSQDLAWSQSVLASALKAERLGYFTSSKDYLAQENLAQENNVHFSRSYLAQFAFTPIAELIQNCCTLQDVQIGSWLSHYLAAKICWKIAWKYGPDIFLSPCLYAQPFIDDWLLQQYPDFSPWIPTLNERIRSKARFPSTLTLILPDNGSAEAMKGNPVWATMLYAEQILKQEWLMLGHQALKTAYPWNPEQKAAFSAASNLWLESWLDSQCQSCWVALPIDDRPIAPIESGTLSTGRPSTGRPSTGKLSTGTPLVRQSLIYEIQQQLDTVRHSQVWKIPTAFCLRSSLSEVDSELPPDSASAAMRFDSLSEDASQILMRGLSQRLPRLLRVHPLESSETPAIASLESDRGILSAKWHLLAAGAAELKSSDLGNHSEAELAAYAAYHRTFAKFSHLRIPALVEQYGGQLISASASEILLSGSLQDWEQLLWEIHQSFTTPESATNLRFGLVIAHRSMPLPIVLKNLWEAKAASRLSEDLKQGGVQVRLLYLDGQGLMASAEWKVFSHWRSLIRLGGVKPILFERIACGWKRHPAPRATAIQVWVTTICDDIFSDLSDGVLNECNSSDSRFFDKGSTAQSILRETLTQFLEQIWRSTQDSICEAEQEIVRNRQIQAWLDLAALTLQNRSVIALDKVQDRAIAPYQNCP